MIISNDDKNSPEGSPMSMGLEAESNSQSNREEVGSFPNEDDSINGAAVENAICGCSRSTDGNSTNNDTIHPNLKRKVSAIIHNEPIPNQSSNNVDSRRDNAGKAPSKKPRILFDEILAAPPQPPSNSGTCNKASSGLKNDQIESNGEVASERMEYQSSSANSKKLVKTKTKCDNKNILCQTVILNISMNRLDIYVESFLKIEKPLIKDEKELQENRSNSIGEKNTKNDKDFVKQLDFALHTINLKKEDEQKYTGCLLLKVDCAVNVFNEIYCFKKEVGSMQHYALSEIKYFRDQKAMIKYKDLFSPEFNITKYFKIFVHASNNLCDNEKIDEFKIYCNRDLDRSSMIKEDIININKSIDPESKVTLYNKFEVSKKHKIYKQFSNCCVLPNLAKIIVNCINDNKPATFRYKLVKEYHEALIKEHVLEIINVNEDGNKGTLTNAKFHKKFINNDPGLSEAAKKLRNQIVFHLPKYHNGVITRKMSFKVLDNFSEPSENSIIKLPNEKYDDLFNAFFEVFKFEVINDDIYRTIKKVLPDDFKHIKDKVTLQALKEEVFLHPERPGNDLFRSLKNKTSKYIIQDKLLKNIEPEVTVEFEHDVLITFEQCLNNFNNKRIVLLLSDYKSLSLLKVKEYRSSIMNDVKESLFISSNTLLENTDNVINALADNSTQILVIRWDENSNEHQTQVALEKLGNSITQGKYAILVSNSDIMTLDYNFNQIIYENQSFDLIPESQKHVLNYENIYLHGRRTRITDIGNETMAAELIKQPKILEDILYRKLNIGNDLVKPAGFKEKWFGEQFEQSTIIHKNGYKDVLNDESKITIISGRPGMGKSICLYNLAEHLRVSEDHLWIIQLNLNEELLKQHLTDENRNYETFIINAIGLNESYKKIFKTMNGELKIKVVLFIDGYDELRKQSYRCFVKELLKQLQTSSIHKIYLASNTKELESDLSICSFSLVFSEAQKEQFLKKYPANILENYNRGEDDLTDTPLHLKMLADLYKGKNNPSSLKNIPDLYREFVKFKLNDNESVAYTISIKKFLDLEELSHLEKMNNYANQTTNKNPNVDVEFEMPEELRHETFTEYFGAKWLLSKSDSHPQALFEVLKIVDRLVEYTSPVFIATYLTPFRLDDLLKTLVQRGCLNFLKYVLSLKKTKRPCLRNVIKSTHPNACQILKCILEYYNESKDEMDENPELVKEYVNQPINDETPLEIAAECGRMDLACELMLNGAETSDLDEHSVDKIANYAVDEIIKSTKRYQPILEKLLMQSSSAKHKLKNSSEYHQFLVYFCVRGRIQLIKRLLNDDPNRCTLLMAKVNDKSLLDHVNESRQLDDNQRCLTVKYILDNVEVDLRSANKFYIETVLDSACKHGHRETFDYFVAQYPGGRIGYLDQAMRKNKLENIKFIMNKKSCTVDDNTALHRAIILNVSLKVVGFLIDQGGIDDKNKKGETPLCLAFQRGIEIRVIKYLIGKGASLCEVDNIGLHPWCYSILANSHYNKQQQIKLMRYLLKKGIKTPERSGISLASDRMREEILQKFEYFKKIPDYDKNYGDGGVPRLHEALTNPIKNNWCSFLIIHGADVNLKDGNDKTPLHIVLEHKNYDMAVMLLQFGAMFDVADRKRTTPIRLLSNAENSEGYKKILNLLKIANKLFLDTNTWDDDPLEFWENVETSPLRNLEFWANADTNPLRYLEFWENVDISPLRYLINCRNSEGLTLFHQAALVDNTMWKTMKLNEFSKQCCQKYEYLPALDVNARDVDEGTPLDIAVKRGNKKVIMQLFAIGASYGTIDSENPFILNAERLIEAAKEENIQEIQELLSTNKYLINARDELGKSVLHHAKNDKIMQLLMKRMFADVDAMDKKGRTPLHVAVKNNQLECAILLLKNKASYDSEDHQGHSHFCRKKDDSKTARMLKMIDKLFADIQSDNPDEFNDHQALANYLSSAEERYGIAPDVIVNVRDSKKKTLLHYAKKFNYLSIADNLVKHGATDSEENDD